MRGAIFVKEPNVMVARAGGKYLSQSWVRGCFLEEGPGEPSMKDTW